ncbi:hypothetical protein HYR69_02595 [Candidatus Sumerlaeota bacterium]|nr:hypothetical protein [Candidatus Sumerlaeota bacterium]
MQERDRAIVTSLVVLMLILWLGFLLHRSPSFPGSPIGHLLGIFGSLLMLVPLAYMAIKRIKPLKRLVVRWVEMRTMLAWHIYAGVLGPILVLIHTGHKFQSPLGITLTALMMVVVLSGFTGRYLMNQITREIREDQLRLAELRKVYDQTALELAARPEAASWLRYFSGFGSRLLAGFFVPPPEGAWVLPDAPGRALRLAESMADLEYAMKTQATFKRWFSRWLQFHIVISFALYGLLVLHVWAAIYFGLRWIR